MNDFAHCLFQFLQDNVSTHHVQMLVPVHPFSGITHDFLASAEFSLDSKKISVLLLQISVLFN